MVKGFYRIFSALFFILFSTVLFAQDAEPAKEFNPLYDPMAIIQRGSYDNFKNIKLLHAAILNFGGGESEFDRLVDEYSEASSLYFREKYIESANAFTRNEKNIHATGMKLAQKYKEEAETLHNGLIKMNVKRNINRSLKGEKVNATADLLVNNAGSGLKKASDLYARSRPVDAIYYYRRTKELCFKYYEVVGEALPEKYEKDIVDNQNQVYKGKEEDQKEADQQKDKQK